jgi:glycosyltransferase involved in cell wall biosynthesis
VKILHISSAKSFGGGERHLVDLCRELALRGHEIHIVVRPTCEWQQRLDFLPTDRIVHSSIRNAFGIFSAQRIARYVRENEIEIVHAHAGRDYIPATVVCRMSKGVRFVLTRHVLFPMKPFHRVALRNVARAIGVSSAVARNLRYIFPADKIVTIPNGLAPPDLDEDGRRRAREEFRFFHGLPFDAPVVAAVGELKPLKGQRDFLLAAGEIAKSDGNARFLVVGRDNSVKYEFRRELRRLSKVLGIGDRVLFLDWVDDLPQMLAATDVLVSPSHSESFGLVILEAMLCGVPVVATDTAGARELLTDGRTGFITPVGDPLSLASATTRLLADEDLRRSTGDGARSDAVAKFSLTRMVDATEAVYRSVLD